MNVADRSRIAAKAFAKIDTAAAAEGRDGGARAVRTGREAMPAFPESALSTPDLHALIAYVNNPVAPPAERGDRTDTVPPPLPPADQMRFSGPFGAQWLADNGLPAIGPPWSELVAYDLNEGTIKWRAPLGTMHGLADKGITHTGGDHTLRAYDKDSGKLLWEKQLEANPDGIPAVYQFGGRQYVVFYAAGDEGGGSRRGMNFKPGKREAQGYYAFALRRRQ